MSELTQQEREKLAFFMGWHHNKSLQLYEIDGKDSIRECDWEPDEVDAQAFMLLDKFDVAGVSKIRNTKPWKAWACVDFGDDTFQMHEFYDYSPLLAICRAVLAAIE